MSDTSITPKIEGTIGRQTRLYHAFVTTAPAALDAPSTLTLCAGPLKDVAGFAVDSVALEDHFALRSHLKSLGISLRSATEPIDDTSTGKLMEGVLASFAQFDNDVRSDRRSRERGGERRAESQGDPAEARSPRRRVHL